MDALAVEKEAKRRKKSDAHKAASNELASLMAYVMLYVFEVYVYVYISSTNCHYRQGSTQTAKTIDFSKLYESYHVWAFPGSVMRSSEKTPEISRFRSYICRAC